MDSYDKTKAEAYDMATHALLDAKSELNTTYFLKANPNCHFPSEGEEVTKQIMEFIELRKEQLAALEVALDNWSKMGEAGWFDHAYARLVERNREWDDRMAKAKANRLEKAND